MLRQNHVSRIVARPGEEIKPTFLVIDIVVVD
jgi:hypothetical protein